MTDPYSPNWRRDAQITRLRSILDRHVSAEDASLSDAELVNRVIDRHRKAMAAYIIDVNE